MRDLDPRRAERERAAASRNMPKFIEN